MVLSLIAAGKDTTASTLTWFIYMLRKHPHIQEKISQEVREATNLIDNSSIDELADNLTKEALEKMQYLLAVLIETTRLYPALPVNGKVCFSDETWPDGFSVKTGDVVTYHAYGMGRMKYIYGVMMQKNFGQRDGLMKMVFSNKKALSNSQPSVQVQGFVWGKSIRNGLPKSPP
ncbi:cytochrome P450 704C1 [Prunus yedoensis var. nudiflora]|uniref:Cytochrome P450 704C1 n=1 Tax=Prunus yedoensis var. nudiflora TaxID=2094558 RepID=A0A314YNP7_PRUYE|nr:cytochrome P450 704C1 [Prunus yedoensis var. nudiflora]